MEEKLCYKFIYCNNYTSNFNIIYCDNTEHKIITHEPETLTISPIQLYKQLLEILDITEEPLYNYNYHIYNYLTDIYDKISLANLQNTRNYHYLINIDDIYINCPKTLAIIYTYVRISDIYIDNMNIINRSTSQQKFGDYKHEFMEKGYENMCKGGSLKIISYQKNIKHNNICYYHNNPDKVFFEPVLLEYDNNFLCVVDGNHRVAYSILNNIEVIPAIIIIQNPEILLQQKQEKLSIVRPKSTIQTRSKTANSFTSTSKKRKPS